MGIGRLEVISADLKKAFDNAIEALAEKRNLIKELEFNRELLKKWRIGVLKTVWPINWYYVISMPFIYGMSIPFLFFHLCLEIYHQICFRIYGIPRVRPQEYFIFDRQLLPYLNWLEKINCVYCSYGNNLLRYAMEISGRTERYWCPIKYHKRMENTHSQYDKFVDYLDAENFRSKWQDLRNFSDIDARDGAPALNQREKEQSSNDSAREQIAKKEYLPK